MYVGVGVWVRVEKILLRWVGRAGRNCHPSVGAWWWLEWVWSPRRRRVVDQGMARLIQVWMKPTIFEYAQLHFLKRRQASHFSMAYMSFDARPSME